ncbi:hypothetical protein PC123_g23913 [Phytophthora cactorum]|nr:hypothetical protein PC123_g23913 [Phytophthora cactorum]
MGFGKALTDKEHWWIIGLHDGGVSLHEISRKTGRSRTSVRKAIKTERGPQSNSGGDKPSAGWRPAVTEREVRLLGNRRTLRYGGQDQKWDQGIGTHRAEDPTSYGPSGLYQDGLHSASHSG